MSRQEFPSKVRKAALERSGGVCECHLLGKAGIPGFTVEGCGCPIGPGNVYFEHIIPDGAGGEPTLKNCAAVTKTCGGRKGATFDAGKVAEVRHQFKANWGIKERKGRPMAGTKASGVRKRMNGKVERW